MSKKEKFLLKCADCGADFFTKGEKRFYQTRGLTLSKRCKNCRTIRKKEYADNQNRILQEKEQRELAAFLPTFPVEQVEIIALEHLLPESTLFIIGNGFDLMHGVPSSYYHFRDTLGRNNEIRETLEFYIRAENLWGDFENNLAYLDRELVLSSIDFWLEYMDVLDVDDDDFSLSSFYVTQDLTTTPIVTLMEELPKRFRRWIKSLKNDGKRSLPDTLLKKEARFITFNYTEFLETLYGIPQKSIVYIHGDRRDTKNVLILGHGHDTDDVYEEWFNANKERKEFQPKWDEKDKYDRNDNPVYLAYFSDEEVTGNWHSEMRYHAITQTVGRIEGYYEDAAKKTKDVLEKNRDFFKSLVDITNIVVIGHSLSYVDEPYFREIIESNLEADKICWYFSWFSLADLKRVLNFASKMNIEFDKIKVFKV